jgi:oligopeptidase B
MKKLLIGFFFLTLLMGFAQKNFVPPIAKIEPNESVHHGEMLIDNYAWMKDKAKKDKDVIDYIKAENIYTEQMMQPTHELQKQLYAEIIERVEEKDVSLPVKYGENYYYWKRNAEQQYSDYYRKIGSLEAEEELLLSVNDLAKRFPYVSVNDVNISPNQRYLAYLIDTTGSEKYTFQIIDLQSGEFLKEEKNPVGDITWANDSHTIFFSMEDISGRTYQVYRHKLGNDINNAALVFQENDGRFYVWTSRSRSERYLFLGTGSKTTSEIWFLDANKPDDNFQLIEPRQQNIEYYVSHANDSFYITTNADDAFNNKIMRAPVKNPQRKYWQEFIPHRDSVTVSIDVFENFLAVYERIHGNVQLRIIDHELKNSYTISFPEKTYSLYYQTNREFNPQSYRFAFESYITPYTVYELNLQDFSMTIAKEDKIHGNYDKNEYDTDLLFAKAKDGTEIPISLVYKKSMKTGSPSPLLLQAYGSYGDASDPYFSVSRLSLLDRGIIFATAHVRGGGEMGKKWYENGKLLHKKNTFSDFIN